MLRYVPAMNTPSYSTKIFLVSFCIIYTTVYSSDDLTFERVSHNVISQKSSEFSVLFQPSNQRITRVKRYSIEGSYWGVRDITWRISRGSRFMSDHDVKKVMRRAFKVWEEQTNLRFLYKPHGKVHIEIMFAIGAHGDGEPFDGRGKILAHAYFPRYGGDVHFDDSEMWSPDKNGDGIDLYAVAVHEIGHSLGLKHSHDRTAIMAPFYQTYKGMSLHLQKDDLSAIDRLYGRPGASITSVDAEEERLPDICKNTKIDAITRIGNGSIYAFQGEYYWELLEGRMADGYPRLIEDDWPFEGSIDAALTDQQGDTYVFKDGRYWLMGIDGALRPRYPKDISTGLVDTPNNIDAALVWHVDERPYFFKKDKFWRYSIRGMPKGWPRSTRSLSRLHMIDSVDAALRYTQSSSFIFVGEKYYRLIGKRFPRIAPGYPRSIAQMWFGCDGKEHFIK